jgi:TIR domain
LRIFLSYSSKHRDLAEELSLTLASDGHTIFFDRTSLASGEEFDRHIRTEVERADLMVFLVSPDAVKRGSYARTEVVLAKKKWPHPEGHVLPVMIEPTEMTAIPPYLRAVTLLCPEGNVPAEVAAHVSTLPAVTNLPAPGRLVFLEGAIARQRAALRFRLALAGAGGLVGVLALGTVAHWAWAKSSELDLTFALGGAAVALLAGTPLRDWELRNQRIAALVLLKVEMEWCEEQAARRPLPRCEKVEEQFEQYHGRLLGV